MFGLSVNVAMDTRRVTAAAEKATFRNLSHASAAIRKTAQDLIDVSDDPSAPGDPPHTRGRRELEKSIAYDVMKTDTMIGPRFSIVGESAAAHEFGEHYKGIDYPARPFMLPALLHNLDRFAAMWAGSINA